MTGDMTVAASVALLVRRELEDDYVGLWKVPWHIRRAMPEAGDEQVQRIASAILESLTGADVSIGTLDEEVGTFLPWETAGAVQAAMAAWRRIGQDPNIGEVAWLALAD